MSMMLRSGPTGSLTRSVFHTITSKNRSTSNLALAKSRLASIKHIPSFRRPVNQALVTHKALSVSLQKYHYSETKNPYEHIDRKEEAVVGKERLEEHPESVSEVSSVHQIFHEKGEKTKAEDEEEDVEFLAGLKSDFRAVKRTFAFEEVPREALLIGLAGVVPYVATSATTLYLAWDINYAALNGSGFIVSQRTAELLLHIVEPLQIGYGAVIISFLGAVHWGLEFAKYGGVSTYGRYVYGVLAPAVAWPTLMLPIEYALIFQFLTFNFLFYFDQGAVTRGWAPHWYTSYRFVLSFIVGASIILSLIGRGRIADKVPRLPGPADHYHALRALQPELLAEEEQAQIARRAAEAEGKVEGDDEEDEEGDDDEDDDEDEED